MEMVGLMAVSKLGVKHFSDKVHIPNMQDRRCYHDRMHYQKDEKGSTAMRKMVGS